MSKTGYLLVTAVLATATWGCSRAQNSSQAAIEPSEVPAVPDNGQAPAPEQSARLKSVPLPDAVEPPPPPPDAYVKDAYLKDDRPPVPYPVQDNPPSTPEPYADAQYDYPDDSGEPPIYASEPPPLLPASEQPACPGDDYLWKPGYWAWNSGGYYWVPGAWVLPPYVEALWTPPFWEFRGGRYRWHSGYWGRSVGFYGGINYGFGYTGRGFEGGYWSGRHFTYNRTVTNIDANLIHRSYERNVGNVTVTRVSYNGGPDGVRLRPTPAEIAVLRERRTPPAAPPVPVERTPVASEPTHSAPNREPVQQFRAETPNPPNPDAGRNEFRRPENARVVEPPPAPAVRAVAPQRPAVVQPAPAVPESRSFEPRHAPENRPTAQPVPVRPEPPRAPERVAPSPPPPAPLPAQRVEAQRPAASSAAQPHIEAPPRPAPQSNPAPRGRGEERRTQ
jgi:hypothetical protein